MSHTCVIDRGARFEGLLSCGRMVRIEGDLVGAVRGEGLLVIAAGAHVQADVEVGSLRIEGKLEGAVRAREKIVVGAGAQVRGPLETTALEVNEGASIEGPVTMPEVARAIEDAPNRSPLESGCGLTEDPA